MGFIKESSFTVNDVFCKTNSLEDYECKPVAQYDSVFNTNNGSSVYKSVADFVYDTLKYNYNSVAIDYYSQLSSKRVFDLVKGTYQAEKYKYDVFLNPTEVVKESGTFSNPQFES